MLQHVTFPDSVRQDDFERLSRMIYAVLVLKVNTSAGVVSQQIAFNKNCYQRVYVNTP